MTDTNTADTTIDAWTPPPDEALNPVSVFSGTVEVLNTAIDVVRQAIEVRVQQRALLNDEVRQLRDQLDRLERMQRVATSERVSQRRDDSA